MTSRRFPAYGKKLMELRHAGKVPSRKIIVTFEWKIAQTYPRIVISDYTSIKNLNFNCLAGLPVEIVYHNKDAHKIDAVAQEILTVNPCYLSILALDLIDTGEARTLLIPCEEYKLQGVT